MRRVVLGACALAAALIFGAGFSARAAAVNEARLMARTPAKTLGAYHLFVDPGGRRPNDRVMPYALNTILFSDYAVKFRYVYIPRGKTATYKGEGLIDFPVGTTLIKVFSYPADFRKPDDKIRYIETRLLIRRPDGWTPLAYVWNAAQNKAVLKRAGLRTKVTFINHAGTRQTIAYGVPNANQCKECHSASKVVTPIGPKARNLNLDYPYGVGVENQLSHWARIGILKGLPAIASVPRLPRWDDPSEPLAARARAYLDVNCGHCHNPKGLASNSGLYLTYRETNPTALGLYKRPVAAGRGTGGLQFAVVPGHPEKSFLLYRMETTVPGDMMPQIGRTLTHEEADRLISDYIAQMKPAAK